jgi:hypothetical protein
LLVSPRLSERPPKDVSSDIEASLDISTACAGAGGGEVGGGELVGDEAEPNPKLVCPNTFVPEGVKDPNPPPEGLLKAVGVEDVPNVPPKALGVEDNPNVLPPLDEPNALEVEEAPPNALGDDAKAPNPD